VYRIDWAEEKEMKNSDLLSKPLDADYEVRNNGGRTITIRAYAGKAKSVEIPGMIQGIPVTVLDKRSFQKMDIQQVMLPEGITDIEEACFLNNELQELAIPRTVVSIMCAAFYKNKINRVEFSEGLKTLGNFCFYGNLLTRIHLPLSCTRIGIGAFDENPLTKIVIGSGVQLATDSKIYAVSPKFDQSYIGHDRQGGTYLFNGDTWVLERKISRESGYTQEV
jgi:hypothetical protein